eukprot:1762577-Rhodomonas_salina.3
MSMRAHKGRSEPGSDSKACSIGRPGDMADMAAGPIWPAAIIGWAGVRQYCLELGPGVILREKMRVNGSKSVGKRDLEGGHALVLGLCAWQRPLSTHTDTHSACTLAQAQG